MLRIIRISTIHLKLHGYDKKYKINIAMFLLLLVLIIIYSFFKLLLISFVLDRIIFNSL